LSLGFDKDQPPFGYREVRALNTEKPRRPDIPNGTPKTNQAIQPETKPNPKPKKPVQSTQIHIPKQPQKIIMPLRIFRAKNPERTKYLWGRARLYAKFSRFPEIWYRAEHSRILQDRQKTRHFLERFLSSATFLSDSLISPIYQHLVKASVSNLWNFDGCLNILVNKNLMKESQLKM
jgi:hypothetical protein